MILPTWWCQDCEVEKPSIEFNTYGVCSRCFMVRYEARRDERGARDPRYRSRVRRERLLAKAKREPYKRTEIFARDGWICQLCGEPVDPTVKAPDRRSASIDHVVPLSLGGDDTPANVQLAHFGCNSAKCDRVDGEAS